MTNKIIWAPWRMKYLLRKKQKGCTFCKKLRSKKDKDNLVLFRGKTCFIVLNLYPYCNGHLLVLPNRHIATLDKLNANELLELMKLTKLSTKLLKKVFNPQGFNIGMNIGEIAGAGIASHLHMHIVPRWKADTNYLTAISNMRVIAETLKKTYQKLKSTLKIL